MCRMRRTLFALTIVVSAAFGLLHAQTPVRRAQAPAPATLMTAPMPGVDPALFKGLKYRLVGPSRGGRVTTVTGVPSQPKTFYMGAASGGVVRTTGGGGAWVPITDGKGPLGSTGPIAGAGFKPHNLFFGTRPDGGRRH